MRQTAGDSPFLRTSENSYSDRQSSTGNKIPVEELKDFSRDWFIEARIKGHTAQSIKSRKARLGKFFWFLEYREFESVGTTELKEFILYLQTAHEYAEGRWNNPQLVTPMQPVTVGNYHRIVKAFFNYMVEEELIDFNPMRRVKVANAQTEIKHPVSNENIIKLLAAAKLSDTPKRDVAIVLTLLDTGMRASELCGLTRGDFDEDNLALRVVGKGKKVRTVRICPKTYKSLRVYLRKTPKTAETALFVSRKGVLNASGLFQIIKRLAERAGIQNPGCHAFRRSFAVNMLRSGANAFTVQILLGHRDLTMTRRYCMVAEADITEQHRQHSPVEMLKF